MRITIDDDTDIDELISFCEIAGIRVIDSGMPMTVTRISNGVEQMPERVQGYIDIADEVSRDLLADYRAHKEANAQAREQAEAERIADLLSRHPAALEKIEQKLEERRGRRG